jgi:group II intron reverse transcriptase/maturase
MDNTTQAKLALISERARRDAKFQFSSLAHLLNEQFLKECYFKLGRDRASGIDNVTWKEYGENLDANLRDLVDRMKLKRYKPQPVMRVYIPKGKKGKRPLGIPCLEDKIVQKGMVSVMEAIYEADFLDCSCGYRPKRGCHTAVGNVGKIINTRNINHIIEADIKGFFDNMSHEWLLKFLEVRIEDPSFLLLIRRFLKAGYLESGDLHKTDKGSPQGGNLSPMLSNIFLHYVLDLWFEKKIKPTQTAECHLVRYADDFICMVQTQQQAESLKRELQERFAKFGLQLHPDKTQVKSFGRYEKQNAKTQGRRPNTFDFLGFTHYCDKSRKGNFKIGRKTSGKRFQRCLFEMNQWLKKVRSISNVKEWWPTLRAKVTGHYQYYGVSENSRSIRQFYWRVRQVVFKWLNRRSQCRSFTWDSFVEYLEHYPLPKPRIVHNLYALSK